MNKLCLSRASLVAQLVKNLLQACNTGDLALIPESERSPREEIGYPSQYSWASLVSQRVKNPPAMWEAWIQSLGWEDTLKEGTAIHSSILAWRIPMDREAWWATIHGIAKSQQWATQHSTTVKNVQLRSQQVKAVIFKLEIQYRIFIIIKLLFCNTTLLPNKKSREFSAYSSYMLPTLEIHHYLHFRSQFWVHTIETFIKVTPDF